MDRSIKEGMYVRTNTGKLGIVIDVLYGARDRYILDSSNVYIYDNEDIKDANYDLLEIIKPGDFVNGKIVRSVGFNRFDDWCVTVQDKEAPECYIYPNEIDTILTKEQYEATAYKLGGRD